MKNGFKVFLIYLFIPNILSVVFYNWVKENLILANILFYLAILIYFLIISRKDLCKDFKDFKVNFKKYIWTIIKWVLSCFILMMVTNYIIQLFINSLPSNEINNRELIESSPILSLIYLIIIAPLIEEYVFRYSFKNVKNYYLYVLLTSILFASLHLLSASNISELWYLIPYFILGFGFSNVYFKTKNYYASLIGHVIHNILCVIIILLF